MDIISYKFLGKKLIVRLKDRVCENPEEMISSRLFTEVLRRCVKDLAQYESPLLKIFDKPAKDVNEIDVQNLLQALLYLEKMEIRLIPKVVENSERFTRDPNLLSAFIEHLYNYWREFERYLLCDSTQDVLDKRPYRTFNSTIEKLTDLVRSTYRDIEENITGQHPNIYRQVRAGAEIATIAMPVNFKYPSEKYDILNRVPVIRQVLIYPPLLINPPMNKRTGKFERISVNPLDVVNLITDEWICYPAKVGPLLINVYFHEKYFELGFALCNLFALAEDSFLERQPDAVFLFGVPGDELNSLAPFPTVFYDDDKEKLLVGAVPNRDEFGYFGYLKKMMLTLHNAIVMKRGRLPYHGAMVNILLKGKRPVTVLIIGDTGAGKSETLEAFRSQGHGLIQDMTIIADDMGSMEIDEHGNVIGYGTEIGAFVRLDDLQPGYAFGQLDRTIIMNPSQVNARVVLPVTSYDNLIKGYPVDYVLYANNYEEADEDHPLIERFKDAASAFNVFKEGTAMSKGTTTATGLVHTYFVNVFGAVQYKALHNEIALKFFDQFFKKGVFVGQMRTRLGIGGCERKGPEEAAAALLKLIGG